jgi:hypothetical protein
VPNAGSGPVEADVPRRAQIYVAVARSEVQELCSERGTGALHVGMDAQGGSGVLGGRSRSSNWAECELERGRVVRMGKRRVSSR